MLNIVRIFKKFACPSYGYILLMITIYNILMITIIYLILRNGYFSGTEAVNNSDHNENMSLLRHSLDSFQRWDATLFRSSHEKN
jgi:mannose/fructose/N-acetylgalactosamine-specific phosphotransferase system component IID